MDARVLWYDNKKDYVQSMLPDKKILFANVDEKGTARYKEKNEDFDIIMGYNKVHDVYIVCEAKYFKDKMSVSFHCVSKYFKQKNFIKVGYRGDGVRVIIFTDNQWSDFSKKYNYYMYEYQKREEHK